MSITVEELRKMDAGTYQLIDIRSESEIAHGAIPGATAIPGEKIADSELTDKGKKADYLLFQRKKQCGSGGRAL